jgi:hypothetical protein
LNHRPTTTPRRDCALFCHAYAAMLEGLFGQFRASEGASAFLPEAPQAAATIRLDLPDPADEANRLAHQPLQPVRESNRS